MGIPREWHQIQTAEEAQQAIDSSNGAILFFKHSTRCSISSMALNRLASSSADLAEQMNVCYIDLIANRDLSNWLSEQLGVRHESPQVILVKDESVKLVLNHMQITSSAILQKVSV